MGKQPSHSRLLNPDSGWSPKRNDARRSRDTMNSVGTSMNSVGTWKSTFSSWKSSYWKRNSYSTASFHVSKSDFSGVFHLLAEFQNWNVWGNLQNIKNDMNNLGNVWNVWKFLWKKGYGTTQKMPKNTSILYLLPSPPLVISPQRFFCMHPPWRWTLLDELDDGPSCVPRCERREVFGAGEDVDHHLRSN